MRVRSAAPYEQLTLRHMRYLAPGLRSEAALSRDTLGRMLRT